MHAAELTFTPVRGVHASFPVLQQHQFHHSWSASYSATVSDTPPALPRRAAPLLVHAPPPAPPLSSDGEPRRHVPEYLTRRFVENATAARMALLKRRLSEARSPSRMARTQHSMAAWSRPTTPPARWTRQSVTPGRTSHTRPRSASPLLGGRHSPAAGGKAQQDSDLQDRRNLLVNDFIQMPAFGTYRHLEKQYNTDYSTIEGRLVQLERWCREFKQAYSPTSLTPMPRQQPGQHQPVQITHVTARTPQLTPPSLKAAGAWPHVDPSSPAAGLHTSPRAASPAPTISYSPGSGARASPVNRAAASPTRSRQHLDTRSQASPPAMRRPDTSTPSSMHAGAPAHGAPWGATLHSPSFAPWPATAASALAAEQRRSPVSTLHTMPGASLSPPRSSAPLSGPQLSWPNPDVLPARRRRWQPPAAQVPQTRWNNRFVSPPRAHAHSSVLGQARLESYEGLPGPDTVPQARPRPASIPSTSVEAGTSVASHGGLQPWVQDVGPAWEQMYTLPPARPTWADPVSLVPRSSLLKFRDVGAAHQAHGAAGAVKTGGSYAATPSSGSGPVVGLAHRERLQAGIRDLQSEMRQLREDMGHRGLEVAAAALGTDLRRAAVPLPGRLWG